MPTSQEILKALLANPGATDEQIARAMDKYGVSTSDLNAALQSGGFNSTIDKVGSRYQSAKGYEAPQNTRVTEGEGLFPQSKSTSFSAGPTKNISVSGGSKPIDLMGINSGLAIASEATKLFSSPGLSDVLMSFGNAPGLFSNPLLGLGLLAGAKIAEKVDNGGTYSANAGFMATVPPALKNSGLQQAESFDSGFTPYVYTRRSDTGTANEVIDIFRKQDASLTAFAESMGLDVDFSGANFEGYDERGLGKGTFWGSAGEEGVPGTPIQSQLQNYTKQFIENLKRQNPDADPSKFSKLEGVYLPEYGDPKSTGKDPFAGFDWTTDPTPEPTPKPEEAKPEETESTEGGDPDLSGDPTFGDTTIDDGLLDEQHRWLFDNGVMTNVDTGEVREVENPDLYTPGEMYSGGGEPPSGDTEELSDDLREGIRTWIINHPRATEEEIRTAMENNGITDGQFIDATGNTPEGIAGLNAGKGDAPGDGDGDGGGGEGSNLARLLFGAPSPTRTTDSLFAAELADFERAHTLGNLLNDLPAISQFRTP